MTTTAIARPLPAALAALRDTLLTDGWSAASPLELDSDGERMAREDRQS